MIKNFLNVAYRNLKKQKAYSFITLSGLIVGLGVFVLFALLAEFILNFDTFHERADRIYAVVQVLPGGIEDDLHSAITPPPLLPALRSEFPEIETGSRFFPAGRMIVKHREKVFYESRMRFVDPDFLSIFSFEMIQGDAAAALSRPNSVVLTRASALKYFGDEDPLGQTLTLDNTVDIRVTGVTKNVPRNSSITYDFLVSMGTADALYSWEGDWRVKNQAAFLLLAEGYGAAQVDAKFPAVLDKYYPESLDSPKQLYLHPLPEFMLNSQEIDCYWGTGGANFIVLWIIAVLLLIIACINYMNLSTARHMTRAREVGMRKVVGANRFHLIRQFLGESLLMALLALPAVIVLYELLRPALYDYFDFLLDISLWDNPRILILLLGATILTGFFAGSYPAFYLSAFKPVSVLKGNLHFGKKGGRFRKTLVVVQFVFSIILIVLTLVSVKQSRHNLKVDLGFDRDRIISVEIAGEARDNLENFKKELVQYRDITYVTASSALPVGWNPSQQVLPEGVAANEKLNMNVYGIDYDFIEMLNMKMLQGRTFSRDFSDTDSFILNLTAVRQLQWENPLGRQLTIDGQKGMVIGVVVDFHFQDLYFSQISPAVLRLSPENLNYMLVKYSDTENESSVVERVRDRWNVLNPDLPFEHASLSTYYEDSFEGDKTSEMTGALGIMAIFLSCLGLLGLSSFAVERKIKEIGIRKVLGASVPGIIRMLVKEFLKLVVIANVIALPIAYFLMNLMIQSIFSYPVTIGADIFIITSLATLLVAFLTVTSQTLKAAQASPAQSLKYE
jgi:putative ABC transport system permease protein